MWTSFDSGNDRNGGRRRRSFSPSFPRNMFSSNDHGRENVVVRTDSADSESVDTSALGRRNRASEDENDGFKHEPFVLVLRSSAASGVNSNDSEQCICVNAVHLAATET